MRLAYFNDSGYFWCWADLQTPGEDEVNFSAEIDEDIAFWRQKYNTETSSVDVYHPEMTKEEAEAQLDADLAETLAAQKALADAARGNDDSSSLYNPPSASSE
jgi:hypothetical protein